MEMQTKEGLCWKVYIAGVMYAILVGLFVLWSEQAHAPLKPRWEFSIVFENKVVYTYPRWFYEDTHCVFFGRHFEEGLKDDRFSYVCVKQESK